MKLLPHLLQKHAHDRAMFIDPPYTAVGGKRAGVRLYDHAHIDHSDLFAMLSDNKCNFLMTYDAAPPIIELVRKHGFHAVGLSMKGNHHTMLPEIVITPENLFA